MRLGRLFWISLLFFSGCTTQEIPGGHPALNLIDAFKLNITEPSGLSLGQNRSSLYTVSDASGMVYHLQTNGQIIEILKFRGNDLEGVAYDSLQKVLWVVEEGRRNLVQLDLKGNEQARYPIDFPGPANSGLEGVAVAPPHTLAVLNEKKPPRFLLLNANYEIAKEYAPGITGDYSGLCADTLAGRWWILSDQDAALFLWDINRGFIKKYYLGLKKGEGLAIDFTKHIVYVVSDSESKLYLFRLE